MSCLGPSTGAHPRADLEVPPEFVHYWSASSRASPATSMRISRPHLGPTTHCMGTRRDHKSLPAPSAMLTDAEYEARLRLSSVGPELARDIAEQRAVALAASKGAPAAEVSAPVAWRRCLANEWLADVERRGLAVDSGGITLLVADAL